MISIAEFGLHTGNVIHGEFSLVGIEACRSLPKERIILRDSSGTASLLFAGNRSFNLAALKSTRLIKAELIPRPMNTGMGGTLLSATPVAPALINNAAAVVPSNEVPLKAQLALSQLVALIDEITVSELKACMNDILQKHIRAIATA